MEYGTIIHGTLREQDLVPAFLSELEYRDPVAAERIQTGREAIIEVLCADRAWDLTELAQGYFWDRVAWLMDELYDALEAAAPEGCYFGAIEGDGSDFGFWPHEPMWSN
jgi:hypothetical protein